MSVRRTVCLAHASLWAACLSVPASPELTDPDGKLGDAASMFDGVSNDASMHDATSADAQPADLAELVYNFSNLDPCGAAIKNQGTLLNHELEIFGEPDTYECTADGLRLMGAKLRDKTALGSACANSRQFVIAVEFTVDSLGTDGAELPIVVITQSATEFLGKESYVISQINEDIRLRFPSLEQEPLTWDRQSPSKKASLIITRDHHNLVCWSTGEGATLGCENLVDDSPAQARIHINGPASISWPGKIQKLSLRCNDEI